MAEERAVIDPTANVLSLVEAANKRQDDLNGLRERLSELRATHLEQVGELRARHQANMDDLRERHTAALRKAESDRLDAIRQVDREDVSKTAMAANAAIATLANTTGTTAEALRNQVASTAAAAASSQAANNAEFNKRLSAVELSQSEGRGKQTRDDPQMERLMETMTQVMANQNRGSGKSEGVSTAWAILGAGVALAAALFGNNLLGRGQPQVVYVPTPAATVVSPQK